MNIKTVSVFIAAAFLISIVVEHAASENRITRFANPNTAFHLPGLKSENEARAMLEKRKDDVRTILVAAGWGGKLDDLLRAAQVGTFRETLIEPGSRLPYVAMRKSGRPSVLWNVVWAGKEAVPAYTLEFESNGRQNRLVLPRPCANFWIVDLGVARPPQVEPASPVVRVPDVKVCVTQTARVSVQIENISNAPVLVYVDGKQVASGTATGGTFQTEVPAFAGTGSHELVAAVGDTRGTGTVTVADCPPVCRITATATEIRSGQKITLDASTSQADPQLNVRLRQVNVSVLRDGAVTETVELGPPAFAKTIPLKKAGSYVFRATATDDADQNSENPCETAVNVTSTATLFFIDALVGKERFLREGFENGRCATIAGARFGVTPRLGEHAELEAAVGGKINFRDNDNSAIFADVAVNGLFSKGFIGGGISFWDLNLEDTRSVALLIHTGFDVTESGKTQIVVEGRLPFEQFDDVENNYMFWGGLRFRF